MAKPITIHTLDSLRARTIEEGDCWLWTGFLQNNTPVVYKGGTMVSVRRLMLELLEKPTQARFVGTKCGHGLCINDEHYAQRNLSEHMTARAKLASSGPIYQERIIKLTQTKRATTAKITMEIAREIRLSEESGPVLAERYGVDRSLIGRVRRGLVANTPPFGKGARLKAHDWAGFSLCVDEIGKTGCHYAHDQYLNGLSKSERIDHEAMLIARTFGMLMEKGLLKVVG